MISSYLKNVEHQLNRSAAISYLCKNTNYKNLEKGLLRADQTPDQAQTIVLLEYVNSACDVTIAEIERVPGTTLPVHEFLQEPSTKDLLKKIFTSHENVEFYTRRKITIDEHGESTLTKYRQLIMRINAELPDRIARVAEDPWRTNYSDVEH
jgi:hypothetical protein